MMHLVQLILPRRRNDGTAIEASLFAEVRQTLLDRFGGVTAYASAPAQGLWQDGARVERDEVVLYEVMVAGLDRAWWAAYRKELEVKFQQQELVVRALPMERL
jgi:2-hydroxychromene-2-carboxylate isomerase